jgi:hypothetical protein
MARTTALDTEIRSRIEAFLGEISSLVRQSALEAVREALGGNGIGSEAAPARRGPGRPRGSGTGARGGNGRTRAAGRGGRRSSEDLGSMTEQILAHVRSNPGLGAEQLGAALGIATKDMRLPMQKLIADGAVRTEGQRRGTKYFAGGRGAGGGGNGRKGKAQRKTRTGRKGGRKGARKGSRKGARKASARGAAEGSQGEAIAASGR